MLSARASSEEVAFESPCMTLISIRLVGDFRAKLHYFASRHFACLMAPRRVSF